MKTWQITLIGAVSGPLIGIPIILVADPALNGLFVYPVVQFCLFLGKSFFPNDHWLWQSILLPFLIVYLAIVGAYVARGARFLHGKYFA